MLGKYKCMVILAAVFNYCPLDCDGGGGGGGLRVNLYFKCVAVVHLHVNHRNIFMEKLIKH